MDGRYPPVAWANGRDLWATYTRCVDDTRASPAYNTRYARAQFRALRAGI